MVYTDTFHLLLTEYLQLAIYNIQNPCLPFHIRLDSLKHLLAILPQLRSKKTIAKEQKQHEL